jgi:DNA-binding transcriptional LysR family regulator
MEILQLEHFLAVAEERTFTRAAERVFRTQPAVSQSVRKLEEEMGVSLFARDLNDVTLTEAGKLLADYAHRMLALRDQATRHVAELKNLKTGTLSIAAHESAAVYLLPGPLRSYLQMHPEIKIGIYQSPLEIIPRQVMDRDVQVGFVKEKPVFRELECVQVHADRMTLVASPRNPLASCRSLHIKDLNDHPFVVHHQCSSTEKVILRLFAEHETRCNIVAELWSFENLKNFVRADVGLAIVPRITVLQELRDKLLVEIPVEELSFPRRTLMIFRSGYLSETARELVNLVCNFNHGRADQIDPNPIAQIAALRALG